MSKTAYYEEAIMDCMEQAGCWSLVEQMTPEQREQAADCLAVWVENESMAFYTPENPLKSENDRLSRKLKWQRELEKCDTCNGRGRLEYSTGPWAVNTGCHTCSGAGKVHPRKEREPA